MSCWLLQDQRTIPRRHFIVNRQHSRHLALLTFLTDHQTLIVSDILKGRGKFSAEWFLVILKDSGEERWALKPINYVLNFFGNGPVTITPRGSIRIGQITVQRKGGDAGRPTANMLQFKINPVLLLTRKS